MLEVACDFRRAPAKFENPVSDMTPPIYKT